MWSAASGATAGQQVREAVERITNRGGLVFCPVRPADGLAARFDGLAAVKLISGDGMSGWRCWLSCLWVASVVLAGCGSGWRGVWCLVAEWEEWSVTMRVESRLVMAGGVGDVFGVYV